MINIINDKYHKYLEVKLFKLLNCFKHLLILLKGKAKYSWPPCTRLFRSGAFYIANVLQNKEVNRTEPSTSLSVPLLIQFFCPFQTLLNTITQYLAMNALQNYFVMTGTAATDTISNKKINTTFIQIPPLHAELIAR
jgi:hypothetical protein